MADEPMRWLDDEIHVFRHGTPQTTPSQPFVRLRPPTHFPKLDLRVGQSDFVINAIKVERIGPVETIACVNEAGIVCLWKIGYWEEPWVALHTGESTWGLDIHPGSALLGVSANNHRISMFDLTPLVQLEKLPFVAPDRNNDSPGYSSNQTSTSEPNSWCRSLVKPFSSVRTWCLDGHQNNVPNIAFSPCGRYLASCSIDRTCILWQVSTGKILQRRRIINQWGWSVKFLTPFFFKSITEQELLALPDLAQAEHTRRHITRILHLDGSLLYVHYSFPELPHNTEENTTSDHETNHTAPIDTQGGPQHPSTESDNTSPDGENSQHSSPAITDVGVDEHSPHRGSPVSCPEDELFTDARSQFSLEQFDDPRETQSDQSSWHSDMAQSPGSETSLISESDFLSNDNLYDLPGVGPEDFTIAESPSGSAGVSRSYESEANSAGSGDEFNGATGGGRAETKGIDLPYQILYGSVYGLTLLEASATLNTLHSDPFVIAKTYDVGLPPHNSFWRLSMMEWIPELSLAIVACQRGRVALVRLFNVTKTPEGRPASTFYVQQILPLPHITNDPLLGLCVQRICPPDPGLRQYHLSLVYLDGTFYSYRITREFDAQSASLFTHI
ncbi:hypothetical protein IWQ62_000263 [Dispira parvispora]|uniref:Uncharacterized protein n=1 Tax=Dispira parvispora TaxID=1520584 RepID=A0A9W8E688_9FUNG|nr:hypothetical protein IWQ62_000263 [Dispira parvispora]